MRDVVDSVSEPERVEAGKWYRMAGVKWYGKGVFERETVRGSDLSSSWVYHLRPGSVVYNRLFAWKGSFAVVPAEFGECYVSNEFPQFSPQPGRLLPDYLYLYCMSAKVNTAVRAHSVGSAAVSRNRLREEFFLDFDILVPPIDYQENVVSIWRGLRAAQSDVERDTGRRRAALESGFFKALGLSLPPAHGLPKAFAVRWSELARWSVGYNQQAQAGMDLTRGRYPVVPLGSLLTLVQYGTSEKANSGGLGTPVLRINNIKDGVIETGELKHLELPSKTREGLLLEDGDILIIRTSGSRDLVGTCAVFHEQSPYVFASYLIRLRADRRRADPGYIARLINSPVGRQQVNAISRPIMQNNINSQEIGRLEIPLPPLEVQRKIISEVQAGLAEIEALRAEASARTAAANTEIERLILGATA
jgi:type I restriction enzyme S subunit